MNKNFYFFPITIETLEEGGFLASCSLLQGCRAEGKTYAEVIENIQDVIKFHLDARREQGSHEIWRRTDGRYTTIPRHSSKSIKRKTLKGILEDFQITFKEFICLRKGKK